MQKRNKKDLGLKRSLTFERALHSWDKWLASITEGRKVLRMSQHPSFHQMMDLANTKLAGLGFPTCTLLEIYWLCCVFADYEEMASDGKTIGDFVFDKLVLPDWFPGRLKYNSSAIFDFTGKRAYQLEITTFEEMVSDGKTIGDFVFDKLPYWFPGCEIYNSSAIFDFVGKRIYPPILWTEAERKFWFDRSLRGFNLTTQEKNQSYEDYKDFPPHPKRECFLILPAGHPVRKYIKRGRPEMSVPELFGSHLSK